MALPTTSPLDRAGNFGPRSRAAGEGWRYVLPRVGHRSRSELRSRSYCAGPAPSSAAERAYGRGPLRLGRRGACGVRQDGRTGRPLRAQHARARGPAGSAVGADDAARRRDRLPRRSGRRREHVVVRRSARPGVGRVRPARGRPARRCAARRARTPRRGARPLRASWPPSRCSDAIPARCLAALGATASPAIRARPGRSGAEPWTASRSAWLLQSDRQAVALVPASMRARRGWPSSVPGGRSDQLRGTRGRLPLCADRAPAAPRAAYL